MFNCAVILCGCGRADGSEIHESVSVLMHLARLGVASQCFAPDQPQHDVVNHLTGQPSPGGRNCLVESARIARGAVKPIAACSVLSFDALVIPGGFGAAKNLCGFARDGVAMGVHPEVERLVRGFHGAGKPIGLCCIAPVIAAKVLSGVTVTLGAETPEGGDAPAAVKAWGSHHRQAHVEECVVDEHFRVATAPAYMYGDANPWQVSVGIGAMVEAVVAMASANTQAAAGAAS
jgi:enhancing lycopene biosynthesis protein 2